MDNTNYPQLTLGCTLQKYMTPSRHANLVFIFIFLVFSKAECIEDFFVYSAPKTGTHLVFKALEMMTNRHAAVFGSYEEYCKNVSFDQYIMTHPNKICHTHRLPPPPLLKKLSNKGIKTIVVTRDPRDQLISLIYFEHKTGNYRDENLVTFPDRSKPLLMADAKHMLDLILHYDLWPYNDHHNLISDQNVGPYLDKKNTYIVKFEELVGEKGGGSRERQVKTLLELADFLDIKNPDIDYVIDHLFGDTWTFRNGKIGVWRYFFYPKHKEVFKKRYGYIMKNLGYNSW